MEHHAVIKALAGQGLDALDMVGRQIRAQLDLHRAVLEVENKIVSHYDVSLLR